MARKKLPTSMRAAIWRAHDKRCIYCTELIAFADLDIDHIVPHHLKDKPEEKARLLNVYGLSNEFNIDGLLNLVPTHRRCNLQKKGRPLDSSAAFHFLSITKDKYNTASKIELEIKEQARKDNFAIVLEVGLDEGRISLEQLMALVAGYTESQNMFALLSTFPFVDSELKDFICTTDADSLYDRPILPRRNGLNKLTMTKDSLSGQEMVAVCTCRDWIEACHDGYYARSTYDVKEEVFFKNVYALVVSLAQAKIPKYKFISDQNASISNFNLLPINVLPTLSRDDVKELQQFQANGVSIPDLITQGRVKIVSSSPMSVTLHYDDSMGLYLHEILRADLNDDGIEDILIGGYEYALGGTYGVGYSFALTRLGIDRPFTLVDDIELDVRIRRKHL